MHPSTLAHRSALAAVLILQATTNAACNRRVFMHVENVCQKTIDSIVNVPTEKAADILIVVDNSGSMAEEQQNLAENFLNQDPAECPLQDLANIPPEYRNPVRALYTDGGVLSRCGFIQLLAAFENDFRVGVITTDVGLCDNRYPEVQGGAAWGYHPQRGCLQPDGAPGGGVRKLIAAADLRDDDVTNDDFAQRFDDTLDNIRTWGSPVERGLDAADLFLHAAPEARAPGCEHDLEAFRRSEASLVVMFLSDEEDCSHGLGGKLEEFGDENEGEICGAFDAVMQPSRCYTEDEALSPVQLYVDSLLAADPRVKVAVIAGGVGQAGGVAAGGCLVGPDGRPTGGDADGDGVNDQCFESMGMSNYVGSGAGYACGPDTADARGGLPCCVADPGRRFYELAAQLGSTATDSICNASFRSTMLGIAAFIAAVDVVALAEEPVNPAAILVELTRAGTTEAELVERLPPGADCASSSGFLLVDERFIQLCGDARPGPGDTISVRAPGRVSEACDTGG